MEELYQRSIAGLESSNPEVVLQSAIWLVEHVSYIRDNKFYQSACELLQTAARENVECLKFIEDNMLQEFGFKAQLFASLTKGCSSDIMEGARSALENLLDKADTFKKTDTERRAQIYSAIEETGDTLLVQKAKKLLE